jgi:hypothetical protein
MVSKTLVMDNGSELTGRFRERMLSHSVFKSLREARRIIDAAAARLQCIATSPITRGFDAERVRADFKSPKLFLSRL